VKKRAEKRAMSVAPDPRGSPDGCRNDNLTDVKLCRRRRVWRRLKAWQAVRRSLALKKQFFAAPILLKRIIGGRFWAGFVGRPWKKGVADV
jgi:hypothetical protein